MDILLLISLVFAVVLLVLIIAGVPVSQKVLNILFLVMVILMLLGNGAISRFL